MSGPSLEQLVEQASHVAKAVSLAMAEDEKTSKQTATNNRAVLRAVMWRYLLTLEPYLAAAGIPREALEPLSYLAGQIDQLETLGLQPPMFDNSGRPFGMTKPSRRALAEGHAAGCVEYLHKVCGFGITISCKTVASIFSHIGHEGRVQDRVHRAGGDTPLSWSTVHMWHAELSDPKPEPNANLNDALRRYAMQEALDGLSRADLQEPISALGEDEGRNKLAERILLVAAQTRVGIPSEQEVTVQASDHSE